MTPVAPPSVNDVSAVFRSLSDIFFVAGAVFCDVGEWLLLLRVVYMTFHVLGQSYMNVVVPLCFASHGFKRIGTL